MGATLSCIGAMNSLDRIQYDMSSIKNKNLPIIWLVGQQNTGKNTHGKLINEKFDFEHIDVTKLLRSEAENDTVRGKIVKEDLRSKRKVNDVIVIDLLKETLLNSKNEKGFVISNFPKTAKQGELFIKEIGNVNVIIYLHTDTPLLIDRAHQRSSGELNDDSLRRDIAYATRNITTCLAKFSVKIESINTSGNPEDVFHKVENVLDRRLNGDRPVSKESDYVRSHDVQQEEA